MVTIEVPMQTLDVEIKRLEAMSHVRMSFVRDRILSQLAALKWVRNGGKSPADMLEAEVPLMARLAKIRGGQC